MTRAGTIAGAIGHTLVLLAEEVPLLAVMIKREGASFSGADRAQLVQTALAQLAPLETFTRTAIADDPAVVAAAVSVLEAGEAFQALVIRKCLEAAAGR